MDKKYNKYCRKCRNSEYWEGLFQSRTEKCLTEKRDGKRITVRLTKRIESKLGGNISELVLKLLAYEVARGMSISDDEKMEEKCIQKKESK